LSLSTSEQSISSDLTINIFATPVSSSSSSRIFPFSPSSISFSSSFSSISKQSVAYVHQSPGSYKIGVELSGPSINRYVVEFVKGKSFVVLKADEEPPSPVMKSATFSSDGTNILVMFDSPTNRGGFVNVFGCGSLLISKSKSSSLNNTTPFQNKM